MEDRADFRIALPLLPVPVPVGKIEFQPRSKDSIPLFKQTASRNARRIPITLYLRLNRGIGEKVTVSFLFDTGTDLSSIRESDARKVFGRIEMRPRKSKSGLWGLMTSVFDQLPVPVFEAYFSFSPDEGAEEFPGTFAVIPNYKRRTTVTKKVKLFLSRLLRRELYCKPSDSPEGLLSTYLLVKSFDIQIDFEKCVLTRRKRTH